ncbi:molybdenum ABC transporter ATP-binding protein [Oceanibacterium hippocampi]|uniref:Sulfate/thiosulfate import ATP-binding protein CysA n=1 Tax=Oceanibacterium hippocampi TaxID=745714 RepID=A0A1Y5SYJ7_9PROT|nr:molybdenum ABC transporter ATP-binding protein [Oceanibacterium hippocampi]SLN49850.1 Sulfate/thiosulfate import ATP-binding protein CysA [Oceanibacterium hippocampi]
MLRVDFRRALPDFALDIRFEAGSGITALLGRSGAGKTQTINHLAGLLRPDSGRIAIDERVLFDSARGIDVAPEKRRLGYVFQEDRLFPHMTVAGNLKYGLGLVPAAARRISLDEVIGLLGIEALLERRPRRLSGGERQRVAIGRALLTSPDLLLMDEPLANIDPPRRAEILPFIERLRDQLGIAIVYVSHNMAEIIRLADDVALIDRGRIVTHGPVEDVMSRLDLRPLIGRHDAGAVLVARVAEHDPVDRLTRLTSAAGELFVPRMDLAIGAEIRVRLRSRDISLSLEEPGANSILNRFRGRVVAIHDEEGAQGDVEILAGDGARIWARVTHRSIRTLALAPGTEVWAMIKSVAIDRRSLGRAGPARD